MMTEEERTYDGPFDRHPWPTRLTTHAVTSSVPHRLHGYGIEDDLARSYSFTEIALIGLLGDVPSAAALTAFEVALRFACPVSGDEAPVHAAIVARVCAATNSAVLGTGALGLCEQARFQLQEHRAYVAALAKGESANPPRAESPAEAGVVDQLRAALTGAGVQGEIVPAGAGLLPALFAVFAFCGLRETWQIESALVLARLPVLASEAFLTRRASFKDYPFKLPSVTYVEKAQ